MFYRFYSHFTGSCRMHVHIMAFDCSHVFPPVVLGLGLLACGFVVSLNSYCLATYFPLGFSFNFFPDWYTMCSLTLQVVLLLSAILTRVYAAIGPVADLNIVNAEISPDGYLRK
jgi:hypothetical protein